MGLHGNGFLIREWLQVIHQVLRHSAAIDLLNSKNWCHCLIGGEPQLVLRILQLILLHIVPDSLGTLNERERERERVII